MSDQSNHKQNTLHILVNKVTKLPWFKWIIGIMLILTFGYNIADWWFRGGASRIQPPFPFQKHYMQENRTQATYLTYWKPGHRGYPVFSTTKKEQGTFECKVSTAKTRSTMPLTWDFEIALESFQTGKSHSQFTATGETRTVFLKIDTTSVIDKASFLYAINPASFVKLEEQADNGTYSLSNNKEFTEPFRYSSGGSIFNQISSGSDEFFCLKGWRQDNPNNKEPYIGYYYCGIGFDPQTRELRTVIIGDFESPDSKGNVYAEVKVESGICRKIVE